MQMRQNDMTEPSGVSRRIARSLLTFSFLAATPWAWAGTVNFTDSFSPPSSQWSNSTGNWTASGGDYYAQQPNNNPPALTFLPFQLTGYTLTVTVNNLADAGIFVASVL